MRQGLILPAIAVVASATLGLGCVAVTADDDSGRGWAGKEATRDISSSVDRGRIDRLEIRVGAGRLDIRGESRGDISIEGTITAYGRSKGRAEEILADVELRERTRGGTLRLEAVGPDGLDNEGYAIDLTLRVPDDLGLEVHDGSGAIHIENVQGGLQIDDGSGEIELEHVGGETRISDGSGRISIRDLDTTRGGSGAERVRISDGSGEIEMQQIVGDLTINDGSGEIDIVRVQGAVEIEDGSGDIRLEEVNGPVEINDGSGSMRIENVVGDVGISDGSGSIRVDEVSGDFRVYSDGSGGVTIGHVSGAIDIP